MIQWSPHPGRNAGSLAAWGFVFLCGVAGFVLSITDRIWSFEGPASISDMFDVNDALAGALMVLVLLVALMPDGIRRGRALFLGLLVVLAVTAQIVVPFIWVPPAGLVPAVTLTVAGGILLILGERRRRNARVSLEAGRLVVHARRQGVEHALPLDSVREIDVKRNAWARLWGYADLVAHARKGTMGKNIERPLLSERASKNALLGNGWDEEGRFVVRAVHPYKKVKMQLEHQIRLARLPPKEREEAELAERLSQDLEKIEI